MKVYTIEVILEALSYLKIIQHRKTITDKEVTSFKDHIQSVALKEGTSVEFIYDGTERLTQFRNLVDILFVDGEMVYRVKPSTSPEELEALASQYRLLHNDTRVPGLHSPLFLSTLGDFTRKSEANCPEFQDVDEKHQLMVMYQLFQLEKQKRELELTLGVIQNNSKVLVDCSEAKEELEQNADMSQSEFISHMTR